MPSLSLHIMWSCVSWKERILLEDQVALKCLRLHGDSHRLTIPNRFSITFIEA
jgi:hypothetical protein